jgi:hypothetical protein
LKKKETLGKRQNCIAVKLEREKISKTEKNSKRIFLKKITFYGKS